MAVHQRKVNPANGPVTVTLSVGFKHVFSYQCVLMKEDGSSQQVVLRGTTIDKLPDEVILPMQAPQLGGMFLAVDGLLSPVKAGKNDTFSIDITVSQNGSVIGKKPIVVSAQTKVTVPILEHVEL